MTLDEAIPHLDYLQHSTSIYITEDDRKALGIGIDAIKDLKLARQYPCSLPNPQLPGETKD